MTTVMITPAGITLLNTTYETLDANYPLHRAIRLLHLKKAEIVEAHGDMFIRSSSGQSLWPMPKILRLVRRVKVAYEKLYGPPHVSKRGVLDRDHHVCAYCGQPGANTVDHVQPRSKGGRSVWTNLVASCKECNNRKRDRTPEEAGMKLRVTPYAPKRKVYAAHLWAV
jgi:5-methylcytosine-specific restriction endonuclease McrA